MNAVVRVTALARRRTLTSMQLLALSILALMFQANAPADGAAIADRGTMPVAGHPGPAPVAEGGPAGIAARADIDADAAGDQAEQGTDCCGPAPAAPLPILVHDGPWGTGGRMAFFDCTTSLLMIRSPMAPGG